MVRKVQHLEKFIMNLRVELHAPPPCHLLLMARKMPFFFPWENIRGVVTSVNSTISILCTLTPDCHSTLASSSPERTPLVWYGASSWINGNCSAQSPGLLSRCIWSRFSVSHELGTVSKVLDGAVWFLLNKKMWEIRQNCLFLSVAFGHMWPVVAQSFNFFLCLIPSLLHVPFQWQ